jgi:hypothetical protein
MATRNSWRNWGLVVFAFSLAASGYYFFADLPSPVTGAQSRGVISESGIPERIHRIPINIGTVWPKSVTSKDVVIENDSNVPWTLAKLSADCGCLAQSLTPEIVQPKQSAILSLKFTAPDSVGSVRRRLTLLFREPQTPVISMQLTGDVQPWCYAVPAEIDFGRIESGSVAGREPLMRTVSLHLRSGEKLNISTQRSAQQWLDVTFPETSANRNAAAGGGGVVVAHVSASALANREGDVTDILRFESSDDPSKVVEVRVRATIAGSLSVEPSRLFLGTRRISEQFTETFVIASSQLRGDDLKRQLSVTHDLGNQITTTATVLEPSGHVEVKCQFTMPEKREYVSGSIKLTCDNGDEIVIPVAVRVE